MEEKEALEIIRKHWERQPGESQREYEGRFAWVGPEPQFTKREEALIDALSSSVGRER